jgi:hypothetical protein
MQRNSTLTFLEIGNNAFTVNDQRKITDKLKQNGIHLAARLENQRLKQLDHDR